MDKGDKDSGTKEHIKDAVKGDLEVSGVGGGLEGFFVRRARAIVLFVLVLAAAALGAFFIVGARNSSTKKDLEKIFEVSYVLTRGVDTSEGGEPLSPDALKEKKDAALVELLPYCDKDKIVGARASLLVAEIYYSNKDYASALKYYKAASAKSAKAYTAALASYNSGACSEELGDKEGALSFYEAAAMDKDFILWTHAAFNAARLCEATGDYAKALDKYEALFNDDPLDEYAKLAHDRVIYIQTHGLSK